MMIMLPKHDKPDPAVLDLLARHSKYELAEMVLELRKQRDEARDDASRLRYPDTTGQ